MAERLTNTSLVTSALCAENALLREELERLQRNRRTAPEQGKPAGPGGRQVARPGPQAQNRKPGSTTLVFFGAKSDRSPAHNGRPNGGGNFPTSPAPPRKKNHPNIYLPPLYKKNASAWFVKVESIFALRGIVDDVRKYHLVLARLTVEELDHYSKYSCFKRAVEGVVSEFSYIYLKEAIIKIEGHENAKEIRRATVLTVLSL